MAGEAGVGGVPNAHNISILIPAEFLLENVVESLGGALPRVTPLRGWHPNESIFCGWIYKNTRQTISWKGGEGASGDGAGDWTKRGHQFFKVKRVTPSVTTLGDINLSDATGKMGNGTSRSRCTPMLLTVITVGNKMDLFYGSPCISQLRYYLWCFSSLQCSVSSMTY